MGSSTEMFLDSFGAHVRSIKRVLAMMTPWSNPIYLNRVWCVFELYTAITMGQGEVEVEIVMPPAAAALFIAELFGSNHGRGINTVWHALSRVSGGTGSWLCWPFFSRVLLLLLMLFGFTC